MVTRARTLAVALLLALVAMVVLAGPAAAHTRLVSSDPVAGAVLGTAPAQVVLRFSESVRIAPDGVRVAGPGGPVAPRSAPLEAGDAVTVDLPPGLADGVYEVSWRVVSDDAHPLAGSVTFTLAQDTASGTVPAAPAPAATAEPAGSAPVDLLLGIARVLAYAAFALLVGSVAFVLVCWPAGASAGWVRRIWRGAAWALAAATVATLLLLGPYLSGRGAGSVLDPAGIATTLSVPTGVALLVRLALLAAVAGHLRVAAARPAARATRWSGSGLAVALALTWSATGHAATGPQPAVGVPLDAAHLLAMAVWLGALPLVVGLCRGAGGVPAGQALAAVRRFSPVAFGCLVALVVTGCYAAVRQVGSLDALVGTPYGNLLLVKLAVVVLAVAAAARSRGWVARLREPEDTVTWSPTVPARGRVATVSAPSRRAERRASELLAAGGPGLGRSVLAEVVLATAVLGVVAALVTTAPAHSAAIGPSVPVTIPVPAAPGPGPYVTGEIAFGAGPGGPAGFLRAGIEPARVGPNTVVVLLTDPAGAPLEVAGMQVVAAQPAAGPDSTPVPVEYIEPGHFHGIGEFARAGRWELSVTVRTGAASTETVQVPIVIGGG